MLYPGLEGAYVLHGESVPMVDPAEDLAMEVGEDSPLVLDASKHWHRDKDHIAIHYSLINLWELVRFPRLPTARELRIHGHGQTRGRGSERARGREGICIFGVGGRVFSPKRVV